MPRLATDDDGDGIPVVLLHGLTATRRYVVMGSKSLERSGHRTIAYDARGHGDSEPAPNPGAYEYADLASDLANVLDVHGLDRAVLAGASMGAHTILRLALDAPERVAGMALITPAYDPVEHDDPERFVRWDALSEGLRTGGVEGFVEAYGDPATPEEWKDTVLKVVRQRLGAHEHLDAVADALRVVPRSRPFGDLHDLERLEIPAVVVASRDDADPGHPLSVGEDYARVLPDARLVVEDEGKSPIAWQGGQLSKVIAELAGRTGL